MTANGSSGVFTLTRRTEHKRYAKLAAWYRKHSNAMTAERSEPIDIPFGRYRATNARKPSAKARTVVFRIEQNGEEHHYCVISDTAILTRDALVALMDRYNRLTMNAR